MERKLATVLFVDLVDSTALVTGTDPEVVRRRVQRFFDQVSHCVITHGGIVEKFAGDAVMAAFGIPQAHEDDAERAVRAGLAILDALEELELEARIGVESGEIVTEDGEATFATGEAVNLAARLEQAAKPGQLVLGPGAHRLTLGRIEVEDLGPVELKGIAQPVWAWRALGTNGSGGGRPRSMQAPLVGRVAELDLLQNTYERAPRDLGARGAAADPVLGPARAARPPSRLGRRPRPRDRDRARGAPAWRERRARRGAPRRRRAHGAGPPGAAGQDRGQPALRRGDDADGRRGRCRIGRAHPGHGPGLDRRAHR